MCWGVEAARHPASFVLLFNVVWQPGAPCDSARYFCYCAMAKIGSTRCVICVIMQCLVTKLTQCVAIPPTRARAARALRGCCTQALDGLRQISRIL